MTNDDAQRALQATIRAVPPSSQEKPALLDVELTAFDAVHVVSVELTVDGVPQERLRPLQKTHPSDLSDGDVLGLCYLLDVGPTTIFEMDELAEQPKQSEPLLSGVGMTRSLSRLSAISQHRPTERLYTVRLSIKWRRKSEEQPKSGDWVWRIPAPERPDAPDKDLILTVSLVPLADSVEMDEQVSLPIPEHIGLLDIFLIELFVVNRTQHTCDLIFDFTEPVGDAQESDESDTTAIVPLENRVKLGPLAPGTCQSVRVRWLAVSPGRHALRYLRVISSSGATTELRDLLHVTVKGQPARTV